MANVGIHSVLNEREHRIAVFITDGKTNKQIAEELQLSVFTIRNQVIRILRKLNLSNRTEIAREIAVEGIRPISLREAAALCGLGLDRVRKLVQEGKLGSTRVGRTWFTSRTAIAIFLNSEGD